MKTQPSNIKIFRQKNHITQEELATYLEVSKPFISMIENDRCSLPLDKFNKLLNNKSNWDVSMLNIPQTTDAENLPERMQTLIQYSGLNTKQFSERLNFNHPQSIYDIINGRTKSLSSRMIDKITSEFPEINIAWLLTGDGEIIKRDDFSNNSGIIFNGRDANNTTFDNRQYYSDSPDVLKAQIELLDERIKEKDAQIKEKDAQIKEKDAQIKEKDAQIRKLLEIISK